ncbi:hypothetical protein [Streptomyces sp. NPDC004135]
MPAASGADWAVALVLGVSAYAPIVIATHFADRDLPRVPLAPARAVVDRAHDAAEQTAQRARLRMAAWLLVLAYHLEQGGAR